MHGQTDNSPLRFLNLNGVEFLKAIMSWEKERFDSLEPDDYCELIRRDFGLETAKAAYPVYFAGNIAEPADKYIIVGINPAYGNDARQRAEQSYLKGRDLYGGYCQIFQDFFPLHARGLIPYYGHIAGFLRRLYELDFENNNWDWIHRNVVALELIPYHSPNTKKFKINDLKKYRTTQFEFFLKSVQHVQPKKPIFINGFPSFRNYFKKIEFNDAVRFTTVDNVYVGQLLGQYSFIGFPFLQQMRVKRDPFVAQIKQIVSSPKIWELN